MFGARQYWNDSPKLVRRDKSDLRQKFLAPALDALFLDNSFHLLNTLLPPKPGKPHLISTFSGPIDRILLTIPAYAVSDMSAQYRDLISQLPDRTEFIVLVDAASHATVAQWFAGAGKDQKATLIDFDDDLNISIWAEDGYAIAKDMNSGDTFFVEPYIFTRYGDGLIGDFVSNAIATTKDTRAPLMFQGGNILIGDDFFLIGGDYFLTSASLIQRGVLVPPDNLNSQDAILKYITGKFNEYLDDGRTLHFVSSKLPVPRERIVLDSDGGQPVLLDAFVGTGNVQPIFHIDMFITLIGRTEEGKFRCFVGDPSYAAKLLKRPNSAYSISNVFDDIAKVLGDLGFDVARTPLTFPIYSFGLCSCGFLVYPL